MSSRFTIALSATMFLAGCAGLVATGTDPAAVPQATGPYVAPPPPASARTVSDFDTTTAAQRRNSAQVGSSDGVPLGSTVASLGDVGSGGIWLETPLVDAVSEGRVVVEATGAAALVELRPSTGGSRLSLPAMRLLDVPLTDLVEVRVYVR